MSIVQRNRRSDRDDAELAAFDPPELGPEVEGFATEEVEDVVLTAEQTALDRKIRRIFFTE